MNFKSKLNPKSIHPQAYKIVETLQKNGFTTYIAGGSVRDLLLGIQPKDFDISTTAHPYQIKKIISQAYVIGRRFRLVLVKRGKEHFEVSTFRRNAQKNELKIDFKGRSILKKTKTFQHRKNNFFGTPEQDAKRRDFTINALFYDPISDQLMDYLNGLDDLKKGLIRMIGDPYSRLKEDPIRILRALRLSYKIEFNIDKKLKQTMKELSFYLKSSNLSRKRQEILKILSVKDLPSLLLEAYNLKILKFISKTLNQILSSPEGSKIYLNHLETYRNQNHQNQMMKEPATEKALEYFYPLLLSYIRSYEFLNLPKPSIFNPISKWNKIFSSSLSPFPFLPPPHTQPEAQEKKKTKKKKKHQEKSPPPFPFLLPPKKKSSQKLKNSLIHLMEKDLGLFKYEQKNFLKSLKIINLLKLNPKIKTHKNKIQSLCNQEIFSLALKISEKESIFSKADFEILEKEYKKFLNP